jgi:hypothetical protein
VRSHSSCDRGAMDVVSATGSGPPSIYVPKPNI